MDSDLSRFADECPVWRRFRKGDPTALAKIFNEQYDSLYCYGRKLVNDEELVKDCIQNLFLKMWTTRHNLSPVKIIKPYLLKSLRRHIGDQILYKSRQEDLNRSCDLEFEIVFSHEDFLISLQTSREQSAALTRSLNHLPTRQREAIFLRFYEALDYEKVAEVMNLNVQSVRNLIYQSLKSIKRDLIVQAQYVVNLASGRN